MNLKRIILRNGTWTVAGMASSMVTGFITAPFLVHRLGQTTYGLWILIASMTSYFNLIDLGLRASITRHVAFFRAKRDQAAINSMLSTAQAILAVAAIVAVIGTLILAALSNRWANVPPEQVASVRLAMLMSGASVAITLILSPFDGMLYAYERFDLLNVIEMISDIGQTIVLIYMVSHGGSIVTVAAIVLIGGFLREISKLIACFRIDRELNLGAKGISAWSAHELFGYGLWKFLWSVGNRATTQCGPLIVGARLTANAVTPYSIASRLVYTARGISTAGQGVLTPTATALHADERHAHQELLFIEGGKYCLVLSLFFATSIILLGKSFIMLWMGGDLAYASKPATILALGEILPMSQWVTYSILLGRGRHRVVSFASFVETFVVIGLGLMLARSFGLVGVCVALAIPATLGRGILPIICGCRVLEVPLWRYFVGAMVQPMMAIALPAAGLLALVRQRPPENWLELFFYGGVFSFAYLVTCCVLVVGPEKIRSITGQLKTTFGLAGGSEAVP